MLPWSPSRRATGRDGCALERPSVPYRPVGEATAATAMFRRMGAPGRHPMIRMAATTTLIAAGGYGIACAPALSASHGRKAAPSPPVIRESFTPLPCSGRPGYRDTLQEEGCAEQRILATDGQINALSRSVFPLLADNAARRRFTAAQAAWFAYRRADCLSRSDLFEGGTLASVVDAQCSAERNVERVRQLRTFRGDLTRNS